MGASTRVGPPGVPGIQGVQGPQGPQGPAGPRGNAGTQWTFGAGVPADVIGSNGDFYIDTTNRDLYKKVAGVYVLQINLRGRQV